MEGRYLLREAYNKTEVDKLARRIKKVYPNFNQKDFSNSINSKIDKLNFGERSKLICENLRKYLPKNFPQSSKILIDSLPKALTKLELTGLENFIVVPETEYIAKYGLDHFDLSMNALKEMTMRLSSEGAIRDFIIKYPEKTMKQMFIWTKNSNVHVRRLASEGCRPRLPLGKRLHLFVKDPNPVIKILEELKFDQDLYVRRSVANNLNDISKDNPEIVVKLLNKWKNANSKNMDWLLRHASRTLLKQGNKDALFLFGYHTPILKSNLKITTRNVKIGEKLNYKLDLHSAAKQKLMIDYIIYFMKSNGKHSKKVFKLAKKNLTKNQKVHIKKNHLIDQFSTRKQYKGEHFLEIMINGDLFNKEKFIVK